MLHCLTWRAAVENPFMTAAERAAAPLLPELPPRDPHAPGQFALADPTRIAAILGTSGWKSIGIRPLDLECTMPESDLIGYIARLGPVGRALAGLDEPARRAAAETIRPAFAPFVQGDTVRFTAACWSVEARH